MDTYQVHIDSTTQAEIINRLSEKLRACYIFPDVAEQICAHLQQTSADGEYTELTDGNLFALALTIQLQEVSHDEHLWVRWHAEPLPEGAEELRFDPGWQEEQKKKAGLDNYGFARMEVLPGNIGYVAINYLHRPAWGGETAVSVMEFLSRTNAIIIDLRKCTGGYPGMVSLVCSYLFGEDPILLDSIYWRDENFTQQYWTLEYVPGSRFPDKPVYLLTSKVTFSAGEEFANILQSRKRAMIIGEPTDGGAHAGAAYRIDPHFEAFIPVGQVICPLTGTNWEGCGVKPDLPIPAEQSLEVAHRLALQSLLKNIQSSGTEENSRAIEIRAILKGMGSS